MTRPLAAAAVVAAAIAAAVVVALVPGRSHPVPPPRHPISAHARLERAALFGDILHGNLDVLVDRRVVDPASVRLVATFGRWIATTPAIERSDVGRVSRVTLGVALACPAIECLPPDPTKRGRMLVRFPPAAISYDRIGGGTGRLAVAWPPVEIGSRMTAIDMAHLNPLDQPPFHATESPPAVTYRISPTLLVALLCAAGAILLATAGLLAVRFAPRPRPVVEPEPPPPPAPVRELTPLERALVLLERARERGGVADQRRALENLAGELRATGDPDLAGSATALAWAEPPPGHDATGALAAAVQRSIDSKGNGHVED